uniref:Uncharacterized protein MANES_18G058000 n=1 Tax=Rhizophora mucronata TaxID=61149 RepID=A0A2P2IY10_RHIMU
MEDSEKRRERLKAMRTAAAQAEASHEIEASVVASSLANPMLETPSSLSSRYDAGATPRFDFYTDPMAAFSADKKRSVAGDHFTKSYHTPPSNTGPPVARFSSPRPSKVLLE